MRGGGRSSEKLQAFQSGLTIARRQLVEHVFDQRRLEHGVRGADAHAGVGEAELDFPPIDWVEYTRDIALLHESPDGNRHRCGGDAHVIGEIAEHHWLLGVEMVENADLMGADVRSGGGIADMAPMAGEIDAGVVAKHGGDVGAQAHTASIGKIVSFVNTNNLSELQNGRFRRSGLPTGRPNGWATATTTPPPIAPATLRRGHSRPSIEIPLDM